MFVIVTYIPSDYVLTVVEKMANAGAGEIGNYRACSFQQAGLGSFEPKAGAQPFIGEVGLLETVEEVRVEMVCAADKVKSVLATLIEHHPYETPAYHVLSALTLEDFN